MHVADAKSLIQQLPANIPVFLWGAPGVGKSSLVKQMANDAKVGFKDVRLTTLDPTDLRGLPYIKDGMAIWANPAILPDAKRDGETGFLLLDELNSAHPTIQAGAYQLVLDRAIGEYKLPAGWRIVAAGNREEDRGVTFTMPRPLANRFTHVTVEHDKAVWIDWAMSERVSPTVIAFIEHNPGLLMGNSEKHRASTAFPTPRTWAYVSDIIKNVKRDDLLLSAIAGTIGDAASNEFVSFLRLRNKLPNLKELFEKGSVGKMPEEASMQCAMYGHVCSYMDELISKTKGGAQALSKDKNFVAGLRFVLGKLNREFGVLITKHINKVQPDLYVALAQNNPDFTQELIGMFGEIAAASRFIDKKGR